MQSLFNERVNESVFHMKKFSILIKYWTKMSLKLTKYKRLKLITLLLVSTLLKHNCRCTLFHCLQSLQDGSCLQADLHHGINKSFVTRYKNTHVRLVYSTKEIVITVLKIIKDIQHDYIARK